MKKTFSFLSVFAFVVLAGASVWLGSLNQDEGWYLYAAKLVSEGKMLYRDFAFTQAPLLPLIYGALSGLWSDGGILSARVFTCFLGLAGILFSCAIARMLAPKEFKTLSAITTFILLANNLYHVYFLCIPKTYALAGLFVAMGFFVLTKALLSPAGKLRLLMIVFSGASIAFAAGARISLGVIMAVVGFALLLKIKQFKLDFFWFGIGGLVGLSLAFLPFVADNAAFDGLLSAQKYHALRGGFDMVFIIGSLSRLVRSYYPIFIFLGLALAGIRFSSKLPDCENDENKRFVLLLLMLSFLGVFIVQVCAPFPYEDYNVPIMQLIAVFSLTLFLRTNVFLNSGKSFFVPLTAIGLTWSGSFGSPLIEQWMTNGQDRFWTRVKQKSELAHLREVAKEIEILDPGGKTLLTQDIYLAIETKRSVPDGLEMGPFNVMTKEEWINLLNTVDCPIAALSGYTFSIEPPVCTERSCEEQFLFWSILKKRYEIVMKEEFFGQQATTLLILKHK